ncbi:MAG TPA: hypothetical protein P5205_11925 [Candidatus Paceibacterota bacterium]|nr:hypothetical protein [Verrucomicrobiota bacterium]HSA11067.1 hypothetical protein [Candidatus Paceibacterota bacterium]
MPAGSAPHFPVEERVARFRQFYQRANDRPLLGFFVGSDYPLRRYRASGSLSTDRPLAPEDFAVAPYLDDCDRLFGLHEACGGDFIWSASAFWGIPWLEAALGCPIFADHATGSIHARSPARFSGPDSLPAFDPRSSWMRLAGDFLDRLAAHSDGRWPIGTTRMRGIADLLSALYGGTEFILAMLERPGEVKQVCRQLTEFWIAFARFQLARIPLFHGGVGSFYYNLWAPPGTVWHQEDAAALLSPALYDKFIREHDDRIARACDAVIMHQHPTKFVPTDYYLRMPFLALELHVDESGPSAEDLHAAHVKILAHKPLVIWGNLSGRDLDWIFTRLPSAGLAVITVVSSPEHAGGIWSRCFPS